MSSSSSSSGKILKNSFWYGLETILETVIFIGTQIAVARYLGPKKMGYFSYINFFVITVTRTSGVGLASTTRKYMSEFLATDRPGVARAVYHLAHKYQFIGALLLTALGLVTVVAFGDPQYRLMSILLILSITPGVMSWVPAQANNAFEDVYPNTVSALGYLFCYAAIMVLTVVFHWDLPGIAAATLIGRTCEVFLRTIPLNRKLRQMPLDELPKEVIQRIRKYCAEAVGIQLLMSVVWDRSEFVFLRHYCSLEQIAFYSISVGLTDKLLLLPRTFSFATGVTLMVESSRENNRVDSIVKNGVRFLFLVTLPVNLGAAAIAFGALRVAYGTRYIAATVPMMVAAVLGIARAFQDMPDILLRSADRQRYLLGALVTAGIFNIGIDWLLIPRYAAVGAAWGNGLSQALGVTLIWVMARRFFTFSLPWLEAAKLLFASGVMATLAWYLDRRIGGIAGLVLAVGSALPVYVLMVKMVGGLEASDRDRLAPVGNKLPSSLRGVYNATLAFLTPAQG